MKLSESPRVHRIRTKALKAVADGNRSPSGHLQKQFNISRTSASSHLRWLTDNGFLSSSGKTRAVQYSLTELRYYEDRYALDDAKEHLIYHDFSFVFEPCQKNVSDICHYGLTEMINNAIDHSNGKFVDIEAYFDGKKITLEVFDNGIGIFQHIATEMDLSDPREAILELHKGKLTTDPDNHTGEGIFFTSRAFDEFSIHSDDLTFSHHTERAEDLLFDFGDEFKGTLVVMELSAKTRKKLKNIFDRYTSSDDLAFDTTIIPIVKLTYNNEPLNSRSQAKRLLSRLDRFRHIILDFKGVPFAGQGFVDEVFRVFQRNHPEIQIQVNNSNKEVTKMINRIKHQT